MQNLEQIRARNALLCDEDDGKLIVGPKGGDVIKNMPSLILNHGLLATAAYAFTEKEGWQKVFDHVAKHLADGDIAIVPDSVDSHRDLMDFLTKPGTTSETLKLATAETLAWLSFARRFIRKNSDGPDSDQS